REKRHPTLAENVVVGAGSAVLGAITLGAGTRVGAGSVVVRDTPPDSVVVGVPGKVIFRDGKRVPAGGDPDDGGPPDPLARAIEQLLDRIHVLEGEVSSIRKVVADPASTPARDT